MKDNWLMTAIITRPAINSQIHFHCSLRMGNEIELVNCLRGGRPRERFNKSIMKLIMEWNGIIDWLIGLVMCFSRSKVGELSGPLACSFGWLWAAAAARQPAKREDKRAISFRLFFPSAPSNQQKLKLIWLDCWMGMELRAKKPTERQLLRGLVGL